MIQQRVCKTSSCGRAFSGGPRAYYCPECRAERQRKQSSEYKCRKRVGTIRRHGSLDICERCGNQYTVNSGAQRFCPDCQPIHNKEYDRETALPFYHEHKDRINPVRNERRRIGLRQCASCSAEFDPEGTVRVTC
ncbi:MAG: hypothetical protein K0Q73_4050 [Paenibacillus sp.]|jgi:uncharacterized Zn ribbon protein|nr:hypothetical protein [Paenibacillus sp.]